MSEKAQESIIYFAKKCLNLKFQIKELQDEEKRYKEELRGIMKEADIKKLNDDNISVEIRYPKSFDPGLLGYEYPELYKKYVKLEKKIVETTEMIINKKDLERFHTSVYKNCMIEGTPRLYIKEVV